MKQKMCITVRGKSGSDFQFIFHGDPQYVKFWREEGFEIGVILNSIPEWAHLLGLTKPWFAVQDFWRWLRIF
jgi:hypothetical protein